MIAEMLIITKISKKVGNKMRQYKITPLLPKMIITTILDLKMTLMDNEQPHRLEIHWNNISNETT